MRAKIPIALTLIVFLGIFLKLLVLQKPLLGNFSSYQAVLAMISRNFLTHNFSNWLLPESNLLMNWKHALHMIYYPLPSLLVAFAEKWFGGGLDFWGRLQAVFFTAGSTVLLFTIAKRFFSSRIGILAALVFTLAPLNLIYGQSFQNEASGMFFALSSLFFITHGKSWVSRGALAGLLFSLSLVVRIHFLFLLPGLFYLYACGREEEKRTPFLVFCLLFWVIPAAWFGFTYYVGLQHDNVLTNLSAQLYAGKTFPNRLLLSTEFYRKVLDDLIFLIINPMGFTFFVYGTCLKMERKEQRVFWIFLLLCGLLVLAMPVKVYDHNFYLYPFLIPVSIFIAMGLDRFVVEFVQKDRMLLRKTWFGVFSVMWVLLTFRFYFHPAFEIPERDWKALKAARYIADHLPGEARIIAAHGSSTDFLYYTGRDGWTFFPFGYKNAIDRTNRLIEEGAQYFAVSVTEELEKDSEFFAYLESHYQRVSPDNETFRIYDLDGTK